MQNKVLLTPVDDLVDIVKKNPNCTLSFLKQKLNLPLEVIEKWLVILEEYSLLKVQYKGFEGFVNISNSLVEKENEKKINIEKLKELFIERAKSKGISFTSMKSMWPIFLIHYEKEIKALFEDKAKDLNYAPDKLEKAWDKYKKELEVL